MRTGRGANYQGAPVTNNGAMIALLLSISGVAQRCAIGHDKQWIFSLGLGPTGLG